MKTEDDYEIGYKCVRKSAEVGGKYYSFIRGYDGCTQYFINKPTVPNPYCGPMAVFSDIKSARNFAISVGSNESIFMVKYKRSTQTKLYTRYTTYSGVIGFPKGTVLADEVILLEDVTDES